MVIESGESVFKSEEVVFSINFVIMFDVNVFDLEEVDDVFIVVLFM